MCSVGKDFLSEANYQKCIEQTLTLQDINLQFIPQHSDVPFSFIQVCYFFFYLYYHHFYLLFLFIDLLFIVQN